MMISILKDSFMSGLIYTAVYYLMDQYVFNTLEKLSMRDYAIFGVLIFLVSVPVNIIRKRFNF